MFVVISSTSILHASVQAARWDLDYSKRQACNLSAALTAGLPALGIEGKFVQLKTSNQKSIKNPHLVNKRDSDFSIYLVLILNT